MITVQHPPWIGSAFEQQTKVRLLLLGESHHGSDPDEVDMTSGVVAGWINGETNRSYRFFTHLAVALSGREPYQISREEVFRPVAFYNYVKRVMPQSRVSPTRSDFQASEFAFREVLRTIRPTHIVACGERLWSNMPSFDPPDVDGQVVNLADIETLIGPYGRDETSALAMHIRHPQAGFNGRVWFPRLQAFFAL